MVASEAFIDTFFHSISNLHFRKSLYKKCADELVEILQRAANDIPKHTGRFLRELNEKKLGQDGYLR